MSTYNGEERRTWNRGAYRTCNKHGKHHCEPCNDTAAFVPRPHSLIHRLDIAQRRAAELEKMVNEYEAEFTDLKQRFREAVTARCDGATAFGLLKDAGLEDNQEPGKSSSGQAIVSRKYHEVHMLVIRQRFRAAVKAALARDWDSMRELEDFIFKDAGLE